MSSSQQLHLTPHLHLSNQSVPVCHLGPLIMKRHQHTQTYILKTQPLMTAVITLLFQKGHIC